MIRATQPVSDLATPQDIENIARMKRSQDFLVRNGIVMKTGQFFSREELREINEDHLKSDEL